MPEPAAPAATGDAGAPLNRPAGCADLFRTFNRLALQGFGGVLPVAHRELVERQRWLSPEQFVELLTLGQVLPGPNSARALSRYSFAELSFTPTDLMIEAWDSKGERIDQARLESGASTSR